ncbi:MAG: carbohydrate binding domain-containing protein [Lachnoclostridium sp.]
MKDGTDISQSAIFLETSWTSSPTADNDLMDFYVDDVSVVAESIPVQEGDNLIKNGGFEDDLTRWTGRENCTLTLDTEEKVSGKSSVKVTDRTVTGSGPQQDVSGLFEAGDIIDVSYNIKYTTGPDTRTFVLTAYYDGTYKNIVGGTAKKGEWTNITGSYTIPEDMNTDNLVFFLETSWTSEQDPTNDLMDYYVDDLVVTKKAVEKPSVDERSYNGSNLKLEWQWNHNPNNACWSLTERAGYLRLTTGSISTSLTDAKNTLTQRTYAPQCTGNVALEVGNMKNGDVAGLAAFAAKYGYVGVKMTDGKKYLVMVGTKESGSDNFVPYEAARLSLHRTEYI